MTLLHDGRNLMVSRILLSALLSSFLCLVAAVVKCSTTTLHDIFQVSCFICKCLMSES